MSAWLAFYIVAPIVGCLVGLYYFYKCRTPPVPDITLTHDAFDSLLHNFIIPIYD